MGLLILLWTCHGARAFDQSYLTELVRQNGQIETMEPFKDSDLMLLVKLRQVDSINEYRIKNGVPEVKLDILASRVANMQAYNAAMNNYHGHRDMNGYKPYLRYGLNGGKDHVAENAFTSSGSGYAAGNSPCSMTDEDKILAAMKEGLDGFMAEGPGGGHHDNIIAKAHNYVGLGFYCVQTPDSEYQIRYYEEFLDRYITFDEFKQNLKPNETVNISGKVIPEDTGAYAVTVYYEPFPAEMTPAQINALGSYEDYTSEIALQIWPWEMKFDKKERRFSFDFKAAKKGFYYVQVIIKAGINSIPYKLTGSVSASTEGLPIATGLIIQVR